MDPSPPPRVFTVSPGLADVLDVVRAAGQSALLIGTHGIGKSEFLASYAQTRGIESFVLDLSLLEATDLTGLPYREGGLTYFAPPAVLPPADLERPSMLVLEELNRCDRSVRQPCLQLLTARRLNQYHLPRACFVAASLNPEHLDYDVDTIDVALESRFVRLHVEPERSAWVLWARQAGVYGPVVRFVERFGRALERAPPRAWTQVASLIEAGLARGMDEDGLEGLASTVLDSMTARALIQHLKEDSAMLTNADLLAAGPEVVARVRGWIAAGRMDLLQATVDQICRHLSQATEDIDRAALERLAAALPADLGERVMESAP